MKKLFLISAFALLTLNGTVHAQTANDRALFIRATIACPGRSYCSAPGIPPCSVCCSPGKSAVCGAGGPGFSAVCKCQGSWLPRL